MYNPQLTVEKIKKMCEIKNISLAELSEACGLNKNTIAVSANSKTGLSAKILIDVSKYLGCSADYLLGKTDSPTEIVENCSINNQAQNFQGNQTNVVQAVSKQRDSMKDEFMQAFDELPLADKVEVMSFAMQKVKKGA